MGIGNWDGKTNHTGEREHQSEMVTGILLDFTKTAFGGKGGNNQGIGLAIIAVCGDGLQNPGAVCLLLVILAGMLGERGTVWDIGVWRMGFSRYTFICVKYMSLYVAPW